MAKEKTAYRCRECGATLEHGPRFHEAGGELWCPNGCFTMHELLRPGGA